MAVRQRPSGGERNWRPSGGERVGRRRYTLALLLLTAFTLLTLDVRGFAPLAAVRSAALAVSAPVGEVAAGAFRPLGDAWAGMSGGAELRRENEELRRRVEELDARVAHDAATETELARLRRAVDLPWAGGLGRVTAQVTSGPIADFDVTVELDKGSDAGIDVGMPVVVGAGLVGSVVQVSGGRTVVRLVSDRSSRVGVVTARVEGAPSAGERTGRPSAGERTTAEPALGLVEGRGERRGGVATGFDLTKPVPVGAVLVTAGTPGSRYPAGIPVGTVERVEVDDVASQQAADVRFAAPLDDLAFVTVLLHRPVS